MCPQVILNGCAQRIMSSLLVLVVKNTKKIKLNEYVREKRERESRNAKNMIGTEGKEEESSKEDS